MEEACQHYPIEVQYTQSLRTLVNASPSPDSDLNGLRYNMSIQSGKEKTATLIENCFHQNCHHATNMCYLW